MWYIKSSCILVTRSTVSNWDQVLIGLINQNQGVRKPDTYTAYNTINVNFRTRKILTQQKQFSTVDTSQAMPNSHPNRRYEFPHDGVKDSD